jgi:hypothetical protein
VGKGATVPRLVIHQREGAMKILRRCPGSSQAGRAITTSFIFNYFLFILSYKLRSDCLRYRLQISPTVLTTHKMNPLTTSPVHQYQLSALQSSQLDHPLCVFGGNLFIITRCIVGCKAYPSPINHVSGIKSWTRVSV